MGSLCTTEQVELEAIPKEPIITESKSTINKYEAAFLNIIRSITIPDVNVKVLLTFNRQQRLDSLSVFMYNVISDIFELKLVANDTTVPFESYYGFM